MLALLLAGLAFLLVRTSWLDEDAYISLRTVANVFAGHGLRWNVDERVQTFTHPLWMGILCAITAVVRDPEWAAHLAGLACSFAALGWLALRLAPAPLSACVALVVCASSHAFVRWSTGGLENALVHLLLAALASIVLDERPARERILAVTLCGSALVLARPDAAWFALPAWIALVARARSLRTVRHVLFGVLPLLAWTAFALVYYGFPFPNTAYAKLITGVPLRDRAERGLAYLGHSLEHDPVTLIAIAGGLLVAALSARRGLRALAAGAALWLIWIVGIGGDHLHGRMLSAPLLVAAILIAQAPIFARARSTSAPWAACAAVCAVALLPAGPPAWSARARAESAADPDCSSLWLALQGKERPEHPWAWDGRTLARSRTRVAVRGPVGWCGYHAGAGVHLLDAFGICDPLLARLPTLYDPRWYPGHVLRTVPRGYVETLETGIDRIQDERVAALYDRLALVVRGELWTRARWRAIWELNTGAFRTLEGVYPPLAQRCAGATGAVELFASDEDPRAFIGIDVDFGRLVRARAVSVEFTLGASTRPAGDARELDLVFLRDGATLGVQELDWPGDVAPGAQDASTVELPVPPAVREHGFDRIRILSRRRSWLPPRLWALRRLTCVG